MSAITIITTRSTEEGMLCIFKYGGTYEVSWFDEAAQQPTIPLPCAQFWTYEAALQRLDEHEVQTHDKHNI